jgi:hypothetical protein
MNTCDPRGNNIPKRVYLCTRLQGTTSNLRLHNCRVFGGIFYLYFDPITSTEQTNKSLSDCKTIEALEALVLNPAPAILVSLYSLDQLEELEKLLTRVTLVPRWL